MRPSSWNIQEHHVLLAGDDPFVGLEFPREHIRLRVEQELRNLLLRLRRRYIAVANNPAELTTLLVRIARPLALQLADLLRLAGKPVPAVDRTAALFAAAAAAFDLDDQALARLADLREGGPPPAGATTLAEQLLMIVARAAARASCGGGCGGGGCGGCGG